MAYRLMIFAAVCAIAEAMSPGLIQSVFWRLFFPVAFLLVILDLVEMGNRYPNQPA